MPLLEPPAQQHGAREITVEAHAAERAEAYPQQNRRLFGSEQFRFNRARRTFVFVFIVCPW